LDFIAADLLPDIRYWRDRLNDRDGLGSTLRYPNDMYDDIYHWIQNGTLDMVPSYGAIIFNSVNLEAFKSQISAFAN
jgi:hypothetical protein